VSSSKSSLWSSITQTSTQISLKVGKNEVISSINVSTESVDIKASKINLSGYVTASDLQSTNASIDNLKNGTTQASHLDGSLVTGTTVTARNTLNANTNFNFKNHAISFKTVTIDGTTYHLMGYT
jgi:hypothetical protein